MMFGSGGNALVARKIGENREQEAREDFTLIIIAAFALSLIWSVLSYIFLKPILGFLGADKALMGYCMEYMIPIFIIIPFTIFSALFLR